MVPGGVSRDGVRRVIPAVLWLVERLARRHEVHVVVLYQEPRPATWRLYGATVHNIGSRRVRLRAVRTLVRLHRAGAFDVIHALWARGAGEVAMLAAARCRTPYLVHVTGGDLVWLRDIRFGARWPWRRALARFVARRADRVTAPSGPMLAAVRRAGARPLRVPLGVDTTLWRPEAPRPRDDARPARIVHVGSINAVKDHPTLLRAVAHLKRSGLPLRLDCVGVDTLDGRIQRLAAELGVRDAVTFHGFLTQPRTAEVVRRADLMVVSSRHEADPVAMLEAAAVGVPTVGTRVGHVRDWAPEAALAVPIGDAEALARGVERLLADDALRLSIAREAQARAVREDADWTCARFEALYRDVQSLPRTQGSASPGTSS